MRSMLPLRDVARDARWSLDRDAHVPASRSAAAQTPTAAIRVAVQTVCVESAGSSVERE